jgi:hypothetical protein
MVSDPFVASRLRMTRQGGTNREVRNRTDACSGGVMTTSRETDWMNHPAIRKLVDEANA